MAVFRGLLRQPIRPVMAFQTQMLKFLIVSSSSSRWRSVRCFRSWPESDVLNPTASDVLHSVSLIEMLKEVNDIWVFFNLRPFWPGETILVVLFLQLSHPPFVTKSSPDILDDVFSGCNEPMIHSSRFYVTFPSFLLSTFISTLGWKYIERVPMFSTKACMNASNRNSLWKLWISMNFKVSRCVTSLKAIFKEQKICFYALHLQPGSLHRMLWPRFPQYFSSELSELAWIQCFRSITVT